MGFWIDGTLLKGYTNEPGVTAITIPDGVKEIESQEPWWSRWIGVFSGCSNLTSIIILEGVTKIGEKTFCGCKNLISITIPDGMKTIGAYAFENCSSLTSVIIPDSVTEISYGAFRGCTSLTSITIPGSIQEIDSEAFADCSSLQCINISETLKIDETTFWGYPKDLHTSSGEKIHHVELSAEQCEYKFEHDMLYDKNYSVRMDHKIKYKVLWAH